MKKLIINGIFAFAFGMASEQIVQAQGTLYLSSLSTNATGSASVASDSWLAAEFGTGNGVGGYELNSIQLAMLNASGNPSGFTVMLYTQVAIEGGVSPGSSLGTLTGSSDPATSGTYTYIAPSDLSLSPSTVYFIVVTAGTTAASGAYSWSEGAYPPTLNYWGGVGNGVMKSLNGSSGWGVTPYLGIAQFAIYATPAPEPGVIGLLALSGLLAGFYRWKARAV